MLKGEPIAMGLGQVTMPVDASMVIPAGPETSVQVNGEAPPVVVGAGDAKDAPQTAYASAMLLMVGGLALTVSVQFREALLQPLAALVVTRYGEAVVTGFGQVTTPVPGLMVMPAGAPTPRDQVIGAVPAARTGAGDV